MKVKVIINPSSGRRLFQQNIPSLLDLMTHCGMFSTVDVFYTKKMGDAQNEAASMDNSYQAIMAVGGDGTIHEVVNGIMRSECKDPTLIMMPAGTVNDFGTHMGIPTDLSAFSDMLMKFHTKRIDLGKSNDRYFLNVAAGGMLSSTAYNVPSEAKTVFGKLAYYAQGVIDFPQQIISPIPLLTQTDKEVTYDDALLFIVANTPSVGGFRQLLPKAKVDDGLLDVLILRRGNVIDISSLLVQLTQGKHIDHSLISYSQVEAINIVQDNEKVIPMDLDGEQAGQLPIEISVAKGAINLLVPKK